MKINEIIKVGQLTEIDFAAHLDDINFPKDKLISIGTVDGQIEDSVVMVASAGNQTVYFLMSDDKMTSFIGFENGYLKNIKNFTKSSGVVRALVGYLVHIKRQSIKISKDEPLTPDGIKWISHLISEPRGLIISDTEGNTIDVESLNKEWSTARSTGISGTTGIVISENFKFGEKMRLNETYRTSQSLLMPYNFYESSDYLE